ncbi:MAG: pirin family protein [Isosphaeraceae bacterium]
MIRVRRSEDRGHFDHGWLDTYHTFSFGDYHDPEQMGFGTLRVLNEDVVRPGGGFGMHGHRDMEILTYVLSGELEHRDDLGGRERIRPGEVQRMTAGTGIRHAEFNPSATEPVHLLQIWILPERKGLIPSYEQKPIEASAVRSGWGLIASPDARAGSLAIRQDVDVSAAILKPEESRRYEVRPGRSAWVQVARGNVTLNGRRLNAGDGAAVTGEPDVTITADSANSAEVLLFDMA